MVYRSLHPCYYTPDLPDVTIHQYWPMGVEGSWKQDTCPIPCLDNKYEKLFTIWCLKWNTDRGCIGGK